MQEPQPRPRRRHARSLLLLAGTVSGLLLAEAACRVLAWSEDRAAQQAFARLDQPRLPATGEVNLGHFVRLSRNPRILYEMLPDIRGVTFMGASLATDSHGFRGPERPLGKPANAFRIVALGDSVAFGWGVEEPDTMLRLLETRLRAMLPDRQVDLINMAVPGYNTAMEIAAFEEKGLPFRPDLVIIDFCGNDIDLPDLLPRHRDYWTLRESYLASMWRRVTGGNRDPWREHAFDHAPLAAGEDRFEYDPDRVPAAYRDMVGWDSWRRSMQRLVELGRQHGFRVVVTSHWTIPEEVLQGCKELGLPLFAAAERVLDYMKEHGIALEDYQGSVLTRSRTDPHPSALHHRLQFESLWAVIERTGALQQLVPTGR